MSDFSEAAAIRENRFSALAAKPFVEVGARGAGSTRGAIKDIFRSREMLDLMIRRDLKARYKDSTLGFVWTLVRPLTQLLIYYVVLGHFLGAARGIPEFAIYIFSGLTLFTLFSEVVLGGAGSIVANAGLVKKVYLPREVFPLASIGGALFNFAIQLAILLLATLALGSFPWHAEIWYAIPSLLIVLLYGGALALLLSAANVYLRDIQYLIEIVVMLLMWASPIVYSWSMVQSVAPSWALEIYTNNPLTLAVLGFQQAFWMPATSAAYPDQLALRMIIAIAIGLAFLVVSHRAFRRLQGDFAQAL